MILIDDKGHMVSDVSLDELHAFVVDTLGLSRHYCQEPPKHRIPHYDLIGKRKQYKAFESGAALTSTRNLVIKAVRP